MLKHKLHTLWNFEFDTPFVKKVGWKPVFLLMLAIAILYPIVEVGFSSGNAAFGFDLPFYFEKIKSGHTFSFNYGSFEEIFSHIWILQAMSCILFSTIIIYIFRYTLIDEIS